MKTKLLQKSSLLIWRMGLQSFHWRSSEFNKKRDYQDNFNIITEEPLASKLDDFDINSSIKTQESSTQDRKEHNKNDILSNIV